MPKIVWLISRYKILENIGVGGMGYWKTNDTVA